MEEKQEEPVFEGKIGIWAKIVCTTVDVDAYEGDRGPVYVFMTGRYRVSHGITYYCHGKFSRNGKLGSKLNRLLVQQADRTVPTHGFVEYIVGYGYRLLNQKSTEKDWRVFMTHDEAMASLRKELDELGL